MVSCENSTTINIPTLDVKLFNQNNNANMILVHGFSTRFHNDSSRNINDDVIKFTNKYDNIFIKWMDKFFVVEKRPKAEVKDTIQIGLTGTAPGNYQL